MNDTILIILYSLYSFVLSFLLYRYLTRSEFKYGIKKANVTAIRWRNQSKPILGGIIFFSIFIFGIINYVTFFDSNYLTHNVPIGILLVGTMAFLIGLVDDLLGSGPMFKFSAQLMCALLLINFGVHVKIFDNQVINYAITIFWVVGLMNSINMLDNMDAITSGFSLPTFAFLVILVVTQSQIETWFYLFVLMSLISGVGSFLIFNWNPSKLYMGDNGSLFLGVMLSILSISFVWNIPIAPPTNRVIMPLLLIWLIFTVPLTDTATVSINRMLKGKSPFVGGRDHTTHNLSYLGLSDRQVALTMIIITLISISLAALLIFYVKQPTLFELLLTAIWPTAVFITQYTISRVVKPRDYNKETDA